MVKEKWIIYDSSQYYPEATVYDTYEEAKNAWDELMKWRVDDYEEEDFLAKIIISSHDEMDKLLYDNGQCKFFYEDWNECNYRLNKNGLCCVNGNLKRCDYRLRGLENNNG